MVVEDVRHGGGQYGDDDENRRRRRNPGPDPDTGYTPAPNPHAPTIERIARIDKMSRQVLPPQVTYALSTSTLSDDDIAKASKMFAKNFDLPVDDYFNQIVTQDMKGTPIVHYADPIHGGELTLRSARRLLEYAEPTIIAQWLASSKGQPVTNPRGKVEDPGPPDVRAKAIIRTLNDLTPLVGDVMNFGEALAVSRDVAQHKVGKKFVNNLNVLLQGAMRNEPKLAMATARVAAGRGKQFNDLTDALGFLTGTEIDLNTGVAGPTIDAKTGAASFNEQTYVTLESGVGAIPVLTDLWEAIRNTETSYSEAAADIMAEVKAQEDDNSIGKKVMGGILHYGLEVPSHSLDAVVRVFGDPDAWTGPFLALMGEQGALDPTLAALTDAKDIAKGNASLYDNQRMEDLGWSSGEIMVWELALSIGIPAGASAKAFGEAASWGAKARAAALFGGEAIIDPLASFGKLGRVAASSKYLPFLSEEARGAAVTKFLTGKVSKIGDVTIPEFLQQAAKAGALNYRQATKLLRTTFATDGLHPLIERSIYSWVRRATEAGIDDATQTRAVRNFLADGLGLPIGDPLAREIADIAVATKKAALPRARGLREKLSRDAEIKLAGSKGQELADQLMRGETELGLLGPIQHEIPHVGNYLRRSIRLGDTAVARAWRATAIGSLPERTGSYFRFMPDADIDDAVNGIETVMTRSRVFSQEEIAENRQRFLNAARPGRADREKAMTNILSIINDTIVHRISKDVGVDEQDLVGFIDTVFKGGKIKRKVVSKLQGTDVDQVFYTEFDNGRKTEQLYPMLVSQLRNDFDIIDPVRLRKAAKEQIGYMRELRAMAARTIGKEAPVTKGAFTITPSRIVGEVSRDLWRPAIGLVKAGWVARPAYVLRIVGIDEFSRFLGTMGLMERVRAGRYGAQIGAKLSGSGPEVRAIAERTGLPMDEAVKLRFPGLLENERAASQGVVKFIANAEGDILPPEIEGAMFDQWVSKIKDTVPDPEFLSSWNRVLFQFMNDDMGKQLLEARYNNLSGEKAFDKVMEWFTTEDGLDYVKRMRQVDMWEPEDQVRLATDYLYRLTPQPELARFVREGTYDTNMLAAIDKELWPNIVHGPAITPTASSQNLLRRFGRAWGKYILEVPTNSLIRQPYFKANYSQTYAFLREQALAAGKGVEREGTVGLSSGARRVFMPIDDWSLDRAAAMAQKEYPDLVFGTARRVKDPNVRETMAAFDVEVKNPVAIDDGMVLPDDLDQALQAEARRFAVRRTQQIMFDFTRTGRIAEMAWFVSPFLQPFTEFFMAWPKIIKQNPAMAAYATRLAVSAHESQFFKEDDNGQLVVPASGFLAAAPIISMVTGGALTKDLGGGWNLSMPLASFNMFTNSALPVNIYGVDVPIPTPSLSPPVQWALQRFFQTNPLSERLNQKAMAWLTEYGETDFTRPQDWAIPTWLRYTLQGAIPSWFQEATDQNVKRFMALQQAMGQEVDIEAAKGQAQQFAFLRAGIAAFFPASPRIDFPTADLEAEWQALVEAKGNVGDAWEEWVGTYNPKTNRFEGGLHPDLTLITTSKTTWADPDNPFPMPATEAASLILASEGGKKFARDFPRWAFFIIPEEFRNGTADFAVFNKQIASGEREVLSPEQFAQTADDNQAYAAAFAVREQWTAWQQAHPELESGDNGYDGRQGVYEDQVEQIAEEHPQWKGAASFVLQTRVDPNIMLEARKLLLSEEFTTKTDLGQGLKAYFDMRDALEARMKKAGVSNLDTVVARDQGFAQFYKNHTKAIMEAHPDFKLAYDRFGFDMDLNNVRTAGEEAEDALAPEVRQTVTKWSEKWEVVKSRPYEGGTLTMDDRFDLYTRMRNYANTAYEVPEGENPLRIWWGKLDPNEKRDEAIGIGSRSALYWSRHDWEVFGVTATDDTTKFMAKIERERAAAFDRNNTDPDFELGPRMEQIDAEIAREMKKDPALAKQFKIANTWGYGLKQAVFGGIEGVRPVVTEASREHWESFFGAIHDVQRLMDSHDNHGVDTPGEEGPYYKWVRDERLKKYVAYLREDNRAFKKQWDYLQQYSADPILNVVMPDAYYPFGEVGD